MFAFCYFENKKYSFTLSLFCSEDMPSGGEAPRMRPVEKYSFQKDWVERDIHSAVWSKRELWRARQLNLTKLIQCHRNLSHKTLSLFAQKAKAASERC